MALNKPDLPAGQYTAGDLAKEGLLLPGKNIKINDKIYLAVGNATVTKLIDLQSNIKYPVDVVLQGKISVSALQPHEVQQVKQVYDSYKSGKEILRMVNKGKVETVSFKKSAAISISTDKDTGLSTQSLIETADNVVKRERLSNGQTTIKLHEAKQVHAVVDYKEVQELQTVLENEKDNLSHKDLQDIKKKLKNNGQDNIAKTIEAFEEINKSKTKKQQTGIKSLVTETISKQSTGDSVVSLSKDINANKYSSVTFTKDVSKAVNKIIDTHKVSDSLNPQKSVHGNVNYGQYQIFTDKPSDDALKFTQQIETKKDLQVKVAEIEFQKFSKNAIIDEGKNHEIINQITSRASAFDKRLNTNLKERIKDGINLYTEVKTTGDLGFHSIDKRTALKQLKSSSYHFNQLQNLTDGLKIGYNGNVISDTSTGANFVAQNIIKNQAIQEFNNSHIKTAEIFKTLEDTSPENSNKLSGYLKRKKNATIEKYPRSIQNQTGLLALATGIVGTYFYQQMITGAALKAHRLINNFIEPNEVIEAKRHSSIETSARRILSTDFGGGWTPLTSVIKDMVLHGRSGAIQWKNASKVTGGIEKLRGSFDPIYNKGLKLAENIGAKLNDGTERLSKFITEGGISELAKDGLKYVEQNKKSIGVIAGGVVTFSRLGSNDWRTGTREYEILKKKYRGAHFRDFMESNSVRPDDWRDSLTNIDSRTLTGFGSPWDLKKALFMTMGATAKGSKIFSLAHKTATELAEKYVQEGAGLQMGRVGNREFQAGTRKAYESLVKEIDGKTIAAFYSKESANALSAMATLNPGQHMVLNKKIGQLMSLATQPVHTQTKEFAQMFAQTQRAIASALVGSQKKEIEKTLMRRVSEFKKLGKTKPLEIPKGTIQGRKLNTSKYRTPKFSMKQRKALNITTLDDGDILLTRKSDVDATTLQKLVETGGVRIKDKNSSRFLEVSFQGRPQSKQVIAITNSGRKAPLVELEPIATNAGRGITAEVGSSIAVSSRSIRSNIGENLNEILMDRNVVSGNNYATSTTVLQRLTSSGK